MNQPGLRSLLDDDASSQKMTVKKQKKFHKRQQTIEEQSLVSELSPCIQVP